MDNEVLQRLPFAAEDFSENDSESENASFEIAKNGACKSVPTLLSQATRQLNACQFLDEYKQCSTCKDITRSDKSKTYNDVASSPIFKEKCYQVEAAESNNSLEENSQNMDNSFENVVKLNENSIETPYENCTSLKYEILEKSDGEEIETFSTDEETIEFSSTKVATLDKVTKLKIKENVEVVTLSTSISKDMPSSVKDSIRSTTSDSIPNGENFDCNYTNNFETDKTVKNYSEDYKKVDFLKNSNNNMKTSTPTKKNTKKLEQTKIMFLKDNRLSNNETKKPEFSSQSQTRSVSEFNHKSLTMSTEANCSMQKNHQNKDASKTDFEIPSEETINKIITTVEYYFTDFNILKNNFLLKHIRKNKEGYVNLKLVTSLRKIKNITRNWRLVAYCLTKSKTLELNFDKNKVRRVQPIPKIENTSFGKTLVVFNLPSKIFTNVQLKELFEKFGNVRSAEILTSKSKNFNLYHRKCIYFNPDVASHLFGTVELENYQDLKSALKDEDGHLSKENTMVVVPLVSKYYKPSPRPKRFRNTQYHSNFISDSKRYNAQNMYNFYTKGITSSYMPNDIRYIKYNTRNEFIPRGRMPYEVNDSEIHFRRFDATKPYQNEFDHRRQKNFAELQYGYYNKVPEYWRQNRQLKSNTNLNIERNYKNSTQKN